MLTSEPDYIVLRAAEGLPEGFMPPREDGKWYDRSQIPAHWREPGEASASAVATPTGRFEVRDYDGAVAEVWEFRV